MSIDPKPLEHITSIADWIVFGGLLAWFIFRFFKTNRSQLEVLDKQSSEARRLLENSLIPWLAKPIFLFQQLLDLAAVSVFSLVRKTINLLSEIFSHIEKHRFPEIHPKFGHLEKFHFSAKNEVDPINDKEKIAALAAKIWGEARYNKNERENIYYNWLKAERNCIKWIQPDGFSEPVGFTIIFPLKEVAGKGFLQGNTSQFSLKGKDFYDETNQSNNDEVTGNTTAKDLKTPKMTATNGTSDSKVAAVTEFRSSSRSGSSLTSAAGYKDFDFIFIQALAIDSEIYKKQIYSYGFTTALKNYLKINNFSTDKTNLASKVSFFNRHVNTHIAAHVEIFLPTIDGKRTTRGDAKAFPKIIADICEKSGEELAKTWGFRWMNKNTIDDTSIYRFDFDDIEDETLSTESQMHLDSFISFLNRRQGCAFQPLVTRKEFFEQFDSGFKRFWIWVCRVLLNLLILACFSYALYAIWLRLYHWLT